MIVKTKGIVLSHFKYGETSIIARIFTEEYGYGSYIVSGIRSKKSKRSIGYFQPFSLLELVVYLKESRDLQRISDFKSYYPLYHIHSNFIKSVETMFITEVLIKLLQGEQHENRGLFSFLETSVKSLDVCTTGVQNFHIQFLLKLGPFIGFAIGDFNTLFSSINKIVPSMENDSLVGQLLEDPYGKEMGLSREGRNQLLDAILNFYIHHVHISKPKSLEVLRKVLE